MYLLYESSLVFLFLISICMYILLHRHQNIEKGMMQVKVLLCFTTHINECCFCRSSMLILIIIFIITITEKAVVFVNKIIDITEVQGEELENESTKSNLFMYHFMLLYIVFRLFI